MSRIPIQQPSHSQLDFSDPDRDYPSPRVTPLHLSPAAPASLGHFYHDPRNSSQASLLPLEHGSEHRVHRHSRRTLLLVYIHGFMGNETSFQSFPAHLHNILTVTLGNDDSRDYLVHTKVYPKFKTRHAIKVVTGEFSAWLSRFELPSTDIVLLGHSMGGILAAEVALLQSPMGGRLHASILGIIAFDTPFLGMHPGVISSGIASLFRSPSSPPENSEEGLDPFFTARPTRNFTIVSSKKEQPTSWRESAENFAAKHKGRVTEAAREYLVSHLKFGACLMDPAGLTSRYAKIRHLEDGTEDMGRVRIANYYTESYGGEDAAVEEQSVLLPEPTPVVPEQNDTNRSQSSYTVGSEMENLSLSTSSPRYLGSSPSTPFLTNPTDPRNAPHQIVVPPPPPYTEIPNSPSSNPTISLVPATPIDLDPSTQLPPLPLAPPEQPPDLHPIPSDADKHLCKALKKENKRLIKEHERAVREHAALVHKREKTIESILKMRGKEERKRKAKEVKAIKHQSHPRPSETGGSENELQNLPGVNFGKEPGTSLGNNSHYTAVTVPIEDSKPLSSYSFQQRKNLDQNMSEYNLLETNPHITKKRNPKRFCILPHNYKQDHTWTAVEMTGVDEVGAHCGLFFVGPVYERLVGDVAARIEVWVDDYREYRRQFGIDELGVNQPWND